MSELIVLALLLFGFILAIKIAFKSIEFMYEYAITIAVLLLLLVMLL
tara:strand:- start:697 stop:837 length:141 start_codon:yes stop_codon:yes gene_type:complete